MPSSARNCKWTFSNQYVHRIDVSTDQVGAQVGTQAFVCNRFERKGPDSSLRYRKIQLPGATIGVPCLFLH